MTKVIVKNISQFNDLSIDLTNINEKRKAYLGKLSNNPLKLSYFSWILLKEMVLKEYNLDIDKLELKYNDYGKPLFDEFFFNISHSNNMIAVAISNEPVGVDIQHINSSNITKLSKKMNVNSFEPMEVFTMFSAIEANKKKIGTGIYPSDLSLRVNVSKQVIIEDNNEKYILSIDSEDADIIIE